ncbi:MAG: PTS sugar transporter subunit IIA [Nitrospinae bacterium]|nr:PTS sugar transporter subunit IIA [Nitrospinota bacterium]
MKISAFLSTENIISNLEAEDKEDCIKEVAKLLHTNGVVSNYQALVEALFERESLGTTGIGKNVAIPHAKIKEIDKLVTAFARSKSGIDFDSQDGKPVHFIFLLIAPVNSGSLHLKALARISKLMQKEDMKERLMSVGSVSELYEVLNQEDNQTL